jgi:hypothetical protein
MSTDSRGYWREELALIAILLAFLIGIVALSYHLPFDARLFPLVIGTAGILLTLGIAIEQVRRRGARDATTMDDDDPAAKADWPRYATALFAAPAFGLMFWLVALLTVAILALIGPYLLNVDLPHGLVGDWLIDKLALRAS